MSSGTPIADNKLPPIRLDGVRPLSVRSGKPIQSASLAVLPAL